MSLPSRVRCICPVCNTESTQTVLLSTNTMGPPDLDLRPSEMKRSTMSWWVMECPSCGNVAWHLERGKAVDPAWLTERAYTTCDGISFVSRLASRFYRMHLIAKKTGNHRDAFHAALYAAWACDDARDMENAVLCRKAAIPFLKRYAESGEADEGIVVQYADIMRRAGMHDEVIRQCSDVELSEELLNRLLLFEVEKAKQGDTRCYRVSDAIE